MLCQRRDEVKMLKRLRMMNEIERRAALYVSITGTHSDLYLVTVVAFLGKSASFRLMFFARLISCQISSCKRKFINFHSIWISCYKLFLFKLLPTSLRKPLFLTPWCRKTVSFEILDKIIYISTTVWSTLLSLIFWTDIPGYQHRDRNKLRIDNHHDVRGTETKNKLNST